MPQLPPQTLLCAAPLVLEPTVEEVAASTTVENVLRRAVFEGDVDDTESAPGSLFKLLGLKGGDATEALFSTACAPWKVGSSDPTFAE